jgi:hypothetical protein
MIRPSSARCAVIKTDGWISSIKRLSNNGGPLLFERRRLWI